MLLERGQRGLLVGQTGSGKTQNALFQLANSRVWPITIFDTKIEPVFLSLPDDDDTIEITNSIDEYRALSRRKKVDRPTYTIVRPGMHEMNDFEVLDEYVRLAYDKFGAGLYYFDEILNWHNQGRPVNGLVGLLTRGRSRGKTVLMASQRPGWISRFCLSESQRFYVHWLNDARDKKTLSEIIPGFDRLDDVPKYHFYYYSTTEHREMPRLFKPVPEYAENPARVARIGWL